jgi:16S rRNA (cytosine967-C5)-methyltransferase
LPSFQQGWFYVQDPSTLLAVSELDPQPGESVLDLCAAPGGKLAYIAQLMRNEGRILACDNNSARLELLKENCARLGITCVETALLSTLAAPSSVPSAEAMLAKEDRPPVLRSALDEGGSPLFDRILIDAPCSNTGVMRRRVDLRWRLRLEEIHRLQAAQLELLRQAAPRLKPGGTMVYSTCSLEPEENREVIARFLGQAPGFSLERERELLPFTDRVDGAYVARLRKGN